MMSPAILCSEAAIGRGEQELDAKDLLPKNLLPDFRRLCFVLWGSIGQPGINAEC
jgi:hypothetical protein